MTNTKKLVRPQPLGILPIPAGLLVAPHAGADDADLRALCMGADSGCVLPAAWAFYGSAQMQDWTAALAQLGTVDDPISNYNRFVIAPTLDGLVRLRETLTGELLILVEVAAFTLGLADEVPEARELDGELLAFVLMTQAAAEMERDANAAAIPLLERAVAAAQANSPLFTAQLLGQLASLCRTQAGPLYSQARKYYRAALALLGTTNLPEVRSDLWMQLGMFCQEGANGNHQWMSEAVEAYQEVLRGGLIAEEHSELFALAHNNLGLLFLSMRMSENGKPLSMAIAVQSFREALRICDREANPELWRSIQLNLANALQYLPSSHPEDNLAQAVELYEELITQHTKAFDPVGYGRILSNQANALAHLGIFPPALEKLQEARKLFEWHDESELAGSAMELAEQIHEQIGVSAGKA
jgi:tetratricopeptide (TPR) repeat protein